MSEALSQQERLQAIAEKRKKQTEIENKRRQLEDDRRQLQHLKSKALRERWLLDGTPSAGSEEDEAKRQLYEDEAKTKELEEAILGLEQELEELETGVSAISTKENLSDVAEQVETKISDKQVSQIVEDSVKVVHEVREIDGAVTNGVHQLSSSEVEELIHKADEASMSVISNTSPKRALEQATNPPTGAEPAGVTPSPASIKEITGVEAKPSVTAPQMNVNDASAEKPVTMVFMGYQDVEDADETKKVLGLESTTIKAELVVIEDGENKTKAQEDQAPPNGGPAEPAEAQDEKADKEEAEPEAAAIEVKSKEKQPCKCCSIM
ncbi:paralemmin 1a [Trichomycterus rosablanca]|uniref:paralemmin 1a n=1 Tax=Trichomycterus rosablanca TaxID=2290929 RepID=UPI002F35DB57